MPITVERLSVIADGAERPLLDGISCTFGNGDITLIVGRNGSGKSTLLDALGGLVAFEGSVRIDGLPLMAANKPERSGIGRIGQVFQYPEAQLFARTVQGEFDYSLRYLKLSRREAERRTDEAMREMGLAPAMKQQSPLLLSGGEKRRVALASTIATEPDWLLLDEPTAGLDPEAVDRLLGFLLRRRRESRGGIVIATHDLDLLLPVADRVIALKDGCIAADMSAAELAVRPDVWERANIGMPLSVALAEQLRSFGVAVPAKFLTPEEAAGLTAERMIAPPMNDSAVVKLQSAAERNGGLERERPCPERPQPVKVSTSSGSSHYIESLDPRTKWLFYICFSIGLLAQRDWPGAACGAAITAGLTLLCRVPVRSMLPVLRPFLWLLAISSVVSGIGIGGSAGGDGGIRLGAVSFSVSAALTTTLELVKIILVMVGGILLSATTTPFAMKRGIERMLSPLGRIRFPVEAISLTASLLLRFIPVLRREAGRFNRIAKARGKRVRRSGTVRLRDLPVMIVPLLLSLLQMATDLSHALEARGYTLKGTRRTAAVTLRMKRPDWLAVAAGGALLALMLALSVRT
ncbi:ATP-binding cassette domain-containing protein [Paenibacillus mesophilus]|uniref:ATP-binding cassette domain-containing protein n=1 Tax=Paenibacillus mesophilus TaxID=2582849 RepID=UPI0013052358|nr:ATP-binding cassette domain-containing protein [Paenibacillus mesophilus]